MKRLLPTILLALLVLQPTTTQSAPTLTSSIAPIVAPYDTPEVGGKPVCTATSVALRLWLTAAHCVETPATVAGDEFTIVKLDTKGDLALIKTKELAKPGIKFADELPKPWDEFFAGGFALLSQHPLLFKGVVSVADVKCPANGPRQWDRCLITYGSGSTWGHSGGPVVNSKGELIGLMVGAGSPTTIYHNYGIAISLPTIKKFLLRK